MASRSRADGPVEGGARIPNFFRMSVAERIAALHQRGLLSDADVRALAAGEHTLRLPVADKMIENVVGVFGLPMGYALNFLIDGRDYVVPLVVEEPSIVAGLSGAARMARLSGGYLTETTDPILIGQVQAVNITDLDAAEAALLDRKEDILALANSLHPKMQARGGGARDVEVFRHHAPEDGRDMLVLHLLVDTRDAMGANLVNTMCEGIASLVETITGGKVFLRILSNLTDRALARARVRIPTRNLEGKGFSGDEVRDGIILANDLAVVDPYRAATHNKGIMNGVDALAIATGNDWRAIEAAAHAFAARSGRYRALTRWYRHDSGDLAGEIEIPMKVGTVGGSLETNPSVRINHRLLGSPNARELASIMAAVGLAQNFAALRALSTDGIQQNHMTLHARSVASSAGVPDALFDTVVEALIESGEIKVWKAREIVKNLSRHVVQPGQAERSSACGKVILLGEHAVVYGRPALALPIPLAVEAVVRQGGDGVNLVIPRWGLEQKIRPVNGQGLSGILHTLLEHLGLGAAAMTIEVIPHVPRAMGLGGSAALAVAVIRALDRAFALGLDDGAVNALAYQCERVAHGTPSGIDNTIATYGMPLRYQRSGTEDAPGGFAELALSQPVPLVIGLTGRGGPVSTSKIEDPGFGEAVDEWAVANDLVASFVRYQPLINNHRLGPHATVSLAGQTIAWDLRHGDLLESMHPHHRRAVRKADRAGIAVHTALSPADLQVFRGMYEQTMRRQEAQAFYFFPDAYWKTLLGRCSENLLVLEARLEEKVVAAILCLVGPQHLHYHLGASEDAGRVVGASNRLLLAAAKWGQDRGLTAFHLGGGLGGSSESSLFVFKQRFDPATLPLDFHVGRWVHDPLRYQALSSAAPDVRFFPPWRG